MGQSTDGQICYGVMFEEGYEFPWDDGKYDGDIEDWWRDLCGFKPTIEIYSEESANGYVGGVKPSEDVITTYYDERASFDKENPMPFDLVNYCSGDCPMYILAVKRTSLSGSRGYPREFKPADLTVTEEEKTTLLGFCERHSLTFEGEPQWYLSSYWG